jgi:hypothetical protein
MPAELHANRMPWLIKLRVIRGYVSVMWRPGVHRSVWLCVCYVEAWYSPICLVMLPSARNRLRKQTST